MVPSAYASSIKALLESDVRGGRGGLTTEIAAAARAVVSSSAFVWAVVAAGAGLRLARYLADRSLWGDEGALALNIVDKPYRGLLEPLDFVQGAPTGFLLAEKTAVEVFGSTELALRLFPLLCGIGALVLFAVLARRLLAPEPAAFAVVFLAASDPVVYYSSEVKQYETDVLAVLVLLLMATTFDWRKLSIRQAALAAGVGAALAWFSHPALLVLAALAGSLLLIVWREDRRAARTVLGVAVLWGVSALAAYLVNSANARVVSNAAIQGSGGGSGLAGPLRDAWHAFAYPVGVARTATALAAVVSLVGLFVLARRRWDHALLLSAPIAATFVAAVAGRYPFQSRFVLFLVPFVVLLLAEGTWALFRVTWTRLPVLGLVAAALLVGYPVATGAAHLVSPPGHEEIRSVVRHMSARWQDGDALFVWYQSQYAFRYYAECRSCDTLPAHGVADVVWPPRAAEAPNGDALATHPPRLYVGEVSHSLDSYALDLRPLLGKHRVWLLFSSTWDDDFVRYLLDCAGRRLDEDHATRASVYLYDLSARAAAEGRAACLRAPTGA